MEPSQDRERPTQEQISPVAAAPGYWKTLFNPLSSKPFRIAWCTTVGLQTAAAMQLIGATWTVAQITNRAEAVALLITASNAPTALFSLIGGALADRFERIHVIIGCQVLMLVSALSIFGLSLVGNLTTAPLAVFVFAWFTGLALRTPAYQSFIFSSIPAHSIEQAVSLVNAAYFASRMTGQLLGGIIIFYMGAEATYVIGLVVSAASIATLLQIIPNRIQGSRAAHRLPPTASLISVLKSPPIASAILLVLALNYCASVIPALAANIVTDVYHSDSVMFGILNTSYLVGGLIGGMAFPAISRLGWKYWRGAALAVLGISLILVAIVDVVSATVAIFLLGGASAFAVAGALNADVQQNLRSHIKLQGRVLSIFLMATFGGLALGSATWGIVAGRIGIAEAFIVAGICAISTGLAAAFATKTIAPSQGL
jgi:MFS family permease